MFRLVMLAIVVMLGLSPLLTTDPALARPARRPEARTIETGLLPAAAAEARRDGPRVSVKDRYIVQLKENAGDPLRLAESLAGDDLVPTHVYRHVFTGFAARIGPKQLAALRRNPNVASIEPDRIARAAGELVTGVDRIDADLNTVADIDGFDERVDVDVAIIDSGLIHHPDLNFWVRANCSSSEPNDPFDRNGHGTHVAGTVGALDDGRGVVGVAPGVRLWGIKVLDSAGNGSFADIICGMDVAALHSRDQGIGIGDIEVANMSLTGTTTDNSACGGGSAFHNAACRVVAAGITLIAAAGNAASNANGFVPATYDEVITVSALADSDGQPGGFGQPTTAGPDDTFARFSNFGSDVDLAAPGVDIISTWNDGGFRSLNGTSMASPHVAGAAALYIAEHGEVGPAAVKSALLANRERFDIPNDPDPTAEGIVNVENNGSPPSDTTPPTVTITTPRAGATVKKGATIKLAASDDASGMSLVQVRYCPGTSCNFATGRLLGADTTAPYAVRWGRQPKNGTYTLVAQAFDHAGNAQPSTPVTVRVRN